MAVEAYSFVAKPYTADGKVVADKLLMDADRSIVANHFQLLADRLRSMDASEPMPEEDG